MIHSDLEKLLNILSIPVQSWYDFIQGHTLQQAENGESIYNMDGILKFLSIQTSSYYKDNFYKYLESSNEKVNLLFPRFMEILYALDEGLPFEKCLYNTDSLFTKKENELSFESYKEIIKFQWKSRHGNDLFVYMKFLYKMVADCHPKGKELRDFVLKEVYLPIITSKEV